MGTKNNRLWFLLFLCGIIPVIVTGVALAQQTVSGKKLFSVGVKMEQRVKSEKAFQECIKKFDQALSAFERTRDLHGERMVVDKLAALFEARGDMISSSQYLERLSTDAGKLGDRRLESETLGRLVEIYRKIGPFRKGAEDFQTLANRMRELGDVKGEAGAYTELGNFLRNSGHLSEATKAYEKILDIASAMKDLATECEALNNLAAVSMLSGKYGDAVKYLEKALPAAERLGDQGRVELILVNLGHSFMARGKYAESAASFDRALSLARGNKSLVTESLLLGHLGEVYVAWGVFSEAESVYKQALASAVGLGDKNAEALNLLGIAKCLEQRNEFARALEKVQLAVALYQATGGMPKNAEQLIGSLYLDLDAIDKVEPFILHTGSPALMGRLYLSRRYYDKAKEQYEELLKTSQEADVADDLFTAHTGLGEVNEAAGDFRSAEQHYTAARDITERLRSSLLPSARRSFLAVRVNGFSRQEPDRCLTRVLMRQGRWAESLTSSELAKSRAFADRLVIGPDRGYSRVPKSVQDEEQDLLGALAAVQQLRRCCTRKQDPKRHDFLTNEIEKARKELDKFIDMCCFSN